MQAEWVVLAAALAVALLSSLHSMSATLAALPADLDLILESQATFTPKNILRFSRLP